MHNFKKTLLILLLLISTGAVALPPQGDVEWVWNGTTLNYTIYGLNSGSSPINCGRNGIDCNISMYVDYVGPNHRQLWQDSVPTSISGATTTGEVIFAYNREKLPKSGSITNYKSECISIYIKDKRLTSIVGGTCFGTMTPPPPPPSSVSCDLSPISLRHPPLAPEDIDGNRASANMLVTCTRQATVRIKAMAGDGSNLLKLRADGSLKSTLSVNGAAGNSGTLVTVPGPSGIGVMFTSTLIASGNVEAGNFSASGVAQISIL